MQNRIACPTCSSPNSADAVRCHACGRQLGPMPSAPAAESPVTLHRVMGSEVYTAHRRGKRQEPRSEPSPSEPPAVRVVPRDEPSVEDHSDIIAAAIDRIRTAAKDEGHRFKPYVASKHRKPPDEDRKEEIAMHIELAVGFLRERRFEEAIEPLLKAIARDDESRKAWLLLSEAYLRIGRSYKAAVGYLRVLELSPKDEQGWLGLARVLRALGELATAAPLLDRAVAIHPKHTEMWVERGFVREALQDLPEAMRSFDHVLALKPEHRVVQAKRQELAKALAEAGGVRVAASAAALLAPAAAETAPPAADPAAGQDFLIAEIERSGSARPASATDAGEVEQDELDVPVSGGPDRRARVPTYIEGLDETLDGGIPRGHVVLIEGAPGTMKTSLAFSILLHNASRDGIHCVYLSLEERASSLLRQMGSLGLPLEVKRGSLVVLDPRAASDLLGAKSDWVEALEKGIRSIKEQRGLDLIVIDSLEALEVLAKFKDRRREMYRLFEWLRDLDVTSLVVTERPDWIIAGHVLQGRWDEDFLADGVLHLRIHMISDLEAQRRLRVVKLRGTKHDTGYLALVLDDGRFRVTRTMSP